MIIKWIVKFLSALNSNKRTGELAAGFAFGLLLALVPSGNLLWFFILFISFFLKINFPVMLVFMAISKLYVPLFDAMLDNLGYTVLSMDSMYAFYTSLYNMPLIPLTNFNNSVVMGGFLAGIVLWVPVYFIFYLLVKVYRKSIRDKIADNKIVKAFMKVPLVSKIAKLGKVVKRVFVRSH